MYNIFWDFERGLGKIVCLGENFVDRGGNLGDFLFFYFCFFWVGAERKKFVTFEKTNSFKRGGVRAGVGELVTIMTVVRCWRARVGALFFQK